MIRPVEKPIHWAEAFGLSAVLHVGFAYFVLSAVVDVGAIFDLQEREAQELQITSLSIDAPTVFSQDIGTGDSSGTGAETLEAVGAASRVDGNEAAVTPEVAAPETVEAVVVEETLPGSLDQDTLQPVDTATVLENDTSQRDESSKTLSAPTAGRAELSPLRPVNPTLAPVVVAPVYTAASVSETVGALSAAPSAGMNVEEQAQTVPTRVTQPIQREAPVSDTVAEADDLGVPAPAPVPAASNPATPDPLAADLIARIRASVGATCMIAIPQQQNGAVALQIYAADDAAVAAYADEILDGLAPRPPQNTILVDPRQCAALDYIRGTAGYPTGPMALGLDAARIDSGTELTGRLSGTGGRNITLVLVDDNGVTQDLGKYLTVGANTARFAAPLRRSGVARDTRQLLLAIGTATRPASSSRQNGRLAEAYFGALTSEIEGRATITLAPFDVQ